MSAPLIQLYAASSEMNIILGQLDIAWEDREANYANLRKLLAASPPPAQSLLVLPEMFPVGFSLNTKNTIEEHPQPTRTFLMEMATKYAIYIISGIVSHALDGRGLNQAIIVAPTGAELTRYTKLHPFSFANENVHFDAGQEIVTFNAGDFSVCPFICYDLRFPEIFRHAVHKGANVFVVLASWPLSRQQHWFTLLQARAIENQSYVIGVNRVGKDPNAEYAGRSLVIDPSGRVVLDAGEKETLASVEIHLKHVTDYRKTFPALQDMRLADLGLKPIE